MVWLGVLTWVLSISASHAVAPQNGFWWTPSEGGTGYAIEVQSNQIFLATYTYDAAGQPTWFTASGTLSTSGTSATATLFRTVGGNCLGCAYRPPTASTPQGTVSLTFTDGRTGTIRFPDGSQKSIVAFDFGTGSIPQGLLGTWVMYWIQGPSTTNPTFETRFIQITSTQAVNANGNPLAAGTTSRGTVWAFEFQRGGSLAGYLLGVEGTASGAVLNGFVVDLTRDTVEGVWVDTNASVLSGTFTAQAFRTISRSGTQIRMFAGLPPRKSTGDSANDTLVTDRQSFSVAISTIDKKALATSLARIAQEAALLSGVDKHSE